MQAPDGQGFAACATAAVPGRLTIGRAELCALVWISRCTGDTLAVTDARYLHLCLSTHEVSSLPASLLQGRNGDLWALLLRSVPTTWVRAHLTAAEARLHGMTELDRLGNDAADRLAKATAEAGLPSQRVLDQRRLTLTALGVVHEVIANVQIAALEGAKELGLRPAYRRAGARRKRVRTDVRQRCPQQPVPARGEAPPPGVHDFRRLGSRGIVCRLCHAFAT